LIAFESYCSEIKTCGQSISKVNETAKKKQSDQIKECTSPGQSFYPVETKDMPSKEDKLLSQTMMLIYR